jgi:plastocyanin
VSRALHAHRLVVSTVVVVLVLLGAGAVVQSRAGASSGPVAAGIVGPGRVTVRIDVEHSHFETAPIRVRPHTEVRFVVVNHDPIGHELIVGGPDVQARHASGHEAYHPPKPGEVSVPAEGRASTTYSFHAPGPVEYACHLPRHYQYGMHGIVEVVTDEPAR